LNLRIDDVCSLTDKVVDYIKTQSKTPKTKEEIKSDVDKALEVISLR
jgi:hypothetical protein